MYNDLRKIIYTYYESRKNESTSFVSDITVRYESKDLYDKETSKEIEKEIDDYLSRKYNPFNDDIVTLVKKIRKITGYINENYFEAEIVRHNDNDNRFCERVIYEYDRLVEYYLLNKVWDDYILFKKTYRGINLEYSQRQGEFSEKDVYKSFETLDVLRTDAKELKSENKPKTLKHTNKQP